MKLPNIEVSRAWDAYKVRTMCIAHDYYTHGTNEEYSAMLANVNQMYPDTNNLYLIAEDIRQHSYDGIPVESIMFDLEREAVIVYFEVKD